MNVLICLSEAAGVQQNSWSVGGSRWSSLIQRGLIVIGKVGACSVPLRNCSCCAVASGVFPAVSLHEFHAYFRRYNYFKYV